MTNFILADESNVYDSLGKGLSTFIIVLALILAFALIIFFIISVKKQEKILREKDSVLVDTMITKQEMRTSINTYASKVGSYGQFSLFYIKLDDYETHKEILGEDLLKDNIKNFAERLVSEFKGEANICQYDIDSFLIFDKNEYDYEALEDIAQKILDIVGDSYSNRNTNITLTASVGVALYPTCGTGFKELFENLELATYIAQRDGGSKYIIYYNELREKESNNLEYFNEVRGAMERGELTLYYQPVIDIKSNAIYGFEALLRWDHPTKGIISPANFIPILEQSGDISYLSRWCLNQVILKLEEIEAIFPNRDIKIGINLSVKQMVDENMVPEFSKIIKKHNINTNKIILEVAQYAMFEKMNQVRVNLLRLRDLGFKIATDGLGLDFKSISQIESKPIDVLKLDRTFLSDIEDNQIQEKYVAMLIENANKTNRTVISEGVEDYEHLEYIKKQNIEYVQGYYIAKPFDGKEVVDYIHSEEWLLKLNPYDESLKSNNSEEVIDSHEDEEANDIDSLDQE